MATDFDNDIIASKAWCMLFAIADWAKSKEKAVVSEKDGPSLINAAKETMRVLDELKKNTVLLDRWKEHEVSLETPSEPDQEVLDSYVAFCTAWKNANYGVLANFLPNFTKKVKEPWRERREKRMRGIRFRISKFHLFSDLRLR